MMNVLSVHINDYIPGGPGLAGTRMSPFWILLGLMVNEMLVTTGAIRRAELQSECYHNKHPVLLQAGCPSVAQLTVSQH